MSVKESSGARLSEIRLPVTVPVALMARVRALADRDCATIASTARRLIALGVAREVPERAGAPQAR